MEFNTEFWASHPKGEQKRQQILQILKSSPDATPQEISKAIGLSLDQTKRHMKRIRIEGLLRAC